MTLAISEIPSILVGAEPRDLARYSQQTQVTVRASIAPTQVADPLKKQPTETVSPAYTWKPPVLRHDVWPKLDGYGGTAGDPCCSVDAADRDGRPQVHQLRARHRTLLRAFV